MRNLLLSGGVGHPFTSTSDALASLFAGFDVPSDIIEPDEWERALGNVDRYDVLSVNALRWRMLPARYDHLRADNAYETTRVLRNAVEEHLGRGRPVLALHTSCICFDDWPRWGEILGACWDWDRSFHPVLATVRVDSDEGSAHIDDEVYHGLRVTDPERRVLATARVAGDAVAQNEPPLGAAGIGADQPVVWTRTAGDARILVDTLGHDRRSLSNSVHSRVLRRGVAWLLRAGK